MRTPNPLDAFSPGVNLFQRNLNLCLMAGVVCLVVNVAVQIPSVVLDIGQGGKPPAYEHTFEIFERGSPSDRVWLALNYMTIFLQGCTSGVLSLGLSRIGLNLLDGKEVSLEDMIPTFSQLPGAFVAATTVAVLSTIGVVLCCLPGVFVFGLCMYWPAVMVDQGTGSFASLGRSFGLAMESPKEHFFAGAILIAMWAGGYQCCGLPAVFLAPMSAMVVATSYRAIVPKSVEPEMV